MELQSLNMMILINIQQIDERIKGKAGRDYGFAEGSGLASALVSSI